MITPEEFIKVWQESTSAKQVAEKFGITPACASSKASRFRKKGIPLKYFHRGCSGNDWDALAELAEELMEGE